MAKQSPRSGEASPRRFISKCLLHLPKNQAKSLLLTGYLLVWLSIIMLMVLAAMTADNPPHRGTPRRGNLSPVLWRTLVLPMLPHVMPPHRERAAAAFARAAGRAGCWYH